MNRVALALSLTLVLPQVALAGRCDGYLRKLETRKGEAVVSEFAGMLQCDRDEAEQAFDEFMRAASQVGPIVDLSLVAIDAKLYTPVWNMMEKIPDYQARDEIAKGVGAYCGEHEEVLPFLQGAYFGLRDIQFSQWDDSFLTCESPELVEWIESIVTKPPRTVYDEKYNTLSTAYAQRRGPDALPVLERAAIEAANGGGPFNAIIEKMDLSVQPEGLGAEMAEEDRQRLEAALVTVANAVGPEQAALVADRLYNAGAEGSAASLLPRVYPDRVQSDGGLLYGGASIEACEQQVVIHAVQVSEPAKRWSILADIEQPLRSFKHRLKCDSEQPWPVLATAEPVASKSDLDGWVDEIVQQWTDKGFAVKVRDEKPLDLE